MILSASPLGFGSIEGSVVDGRTRAPVGPFRAAVVTDFGILRALPSSDGAFRLDRCPAGTWKLRVTPGPGGSFTPVERWIALDVNESMRNLQVEVAGRGKAILTLDAPPPQELILTLSRIEVDALTDPPETECRVSGQEAVFDDLPAGVYGVHAVKGQLAIAQPARVRVESGRTTTANLTTVPGRPLFVVVNARDGEASVSPYGVRVRDAAGGFVVFDKRPGIQRCLSGAGASAVLPPGKYVVALDRKDEVVAEQEVTIPKDDGAFASFEIRADDK